MVFDEFDAAVDSAQSNIDFSSSLTAAVDQVYTVPGLTTLATFDNRSATPHRPPPLTFCVPLACSAASETTPTPTAGRTPQTAVPVARQLAPASSVPSPRTTRSKASASAKMIHPVVLESEERRARSVARGPASTPAELPAIGLDIDPVGSRLSVVTDSLASARLSPPRHIPVPPSPCFVHSHLQGHLENTVDDKIKRGKSVDKNVRIPFESRGSESDTSTDYESDMDSAAKNTITRALAETATGVREMSKQLSASSGS